MAKKTIEKSASEEALKDAGQGSATGVDTGRWQQLFILAEHWKSDLDFFYDELTFFRNLIDQHFLSLIEEENIERTRRAVTDLAGLERDRVALAETIASHMRHLASLVEEPSAHDANASTKEHVRLEKSVAEFTRQFRTVKREIFQVSGKALGSEKQRRLVGEGQQPDGPQE